MKLLKPLVAGALAFGIANAASAATFVFNNNGSVFTVDGIKLTVSAATGSVSNSSSGLGVKRSSLESGDMNSDAINEGKDKLIFSFDRAIKLSNLTMKLWDNGTSSSPLDQADLSYNGTTTRLKLNNGNFNLSLPAYVTSFTLTAKGSGSAFRVSSLSASVQPTAPAVPVPAAAWLFGSALIGLAGVSRRRAA